MKFRIWTNGKHYKIQKKTLFGWKWLDTAAEWCNWYAKEHPYLFCSRKEVEDFIELQKRNWKISQIIIIQAED